MSKVLVTYFSASGVTAKTANKLAKEVDGDVFEIEPIKEDSPILKVEDKEKLILSPHIAWASVEARGRLFDEVISNIEAFYNGEERNRVENQK